MNIAFLGATSKIAKDLIESFVRQTDYHCDLYSRNPMFVLDWLKNIDKNNQYNVFSYDEFTVFKKYDVVINFVGVGDPAAANKMGSKIFDVTYEFDTLVLHYLESNPLTKYIFLSSGAIFGGGFSEPVTETSTADIKINSLKSNDWYGVAKLYAEARHRALIQFSIFDVRVFNYFSHTQDINARFLITDIVRAIKNHEILKTSDTNIVRDFITPVDFYQLIQCIINSAPSNQSVDCYTKSPIDKFTLLSELNKKYGLEYKISNDTNVVNGTGEKINYYSNSKVAEVIGYSPIRTSLSGIIQELGFILGPYGKF